MPTLINSRATALYSSNENPNSPVFDPIGPVGVGRRAKKPTVHQLRDYLHLVCHSLGLSTRIVPHQFRHTYASEMLRSGVGFAAVMKLLGHTSPEMTMRYIDVTLSDLLLAAVFLLLWAREQRRVGGLPAGDLIYTDSVAGDCPVLMSHRYGLKGKPDAIVRTDAGDPIPVERKKTRAPRNRPYDGDLIQATAYCVLVEEEFGRAPPFMRIQYADRWFDEPYTPERKRWVLETCARLRQARRKDDCRRSHRIAAKCRNCGQRPNCGQAL